MKNNQYAFVYSLDLSMMYCGHVIKDNNDICINGFGINTIPNNNIISFVSPQFSIKEEIENHNHIMINIDKDVFKSYDKIIKGNEKLQMFLFKNIKKLYRNYRNIDSQPLKKLLKPNETQYFIDNNHILYKSKNNIITCLEMNLFYSSFMETKIDNLDIEVKELISDNTFIFGEIQKARKTISDMYSFFNKKFIQKII